MTVRHDVPVLVNSDTEGRSAGTSRLISILGLIFAFGSLFGSFFIFDAAYRDLDNALWYYAGGSFLVSFGFWVALWLVPKLDG
ncbi:hypothetical protein GCM10022198_21250 [Klugiella xanthotipulae]|uniref:Uncharacterized protein n=1 Tax=Klugiella xanthotipulae TaxID=244735 RepID=A0A543HY01_9MICO|nr:hypothetical protein [Klugiella xanthotipulae]TQM63212.1 hypothetical protein FB466_1468 [Klugiella xanthotipulae]